MIIFRPYLAIFCQLHVCLLQNWDSDDHFEVLNLNWYKSYDKKHKNAKKQKMQTSVFVKKNGKKKEMEIFAYCVITFEPIISKTC
jgi:hypothetical protein